MVDLHIEQADVDEVRGVTLEKSRGLHRSAPVSYANKPSRDQGRDQSSDKRRKAACAFRASLRDITSTETAPEALI